MTDSKRFFVRMGENTATWHVLDNAKLISKRLPERTFGSWQEAETEAEKLNAALAEPEEGENDG